MPDAVFYPVPAYHRGVLPPIVIALALLCALAVLPPARRLQLAGLPAGWIGTYAAAVWILALVMALLPSGRFLFPIVLLAWVGPFIVAPERLGRVLRGGGGRGGNGGGRVVRHVAPSASSDRTRPPDAS